VDYFELSRCTEPIPRIRNENQSVQHTASPARQLPRQRT